MTYTFAEAKAQLAPFTSAYGLVNLSAAVNSAIDSLSQTRTWKRLTRNLRFSITGQYFTLPQDCGRIRRIAIDRTPARVIGPGFEYLSSGPGDFDYACQGFAPAYGVQCLGPSPTMYEIPAAARLIAYSTAVPAQGKVRAKVRDANNDVTVVDIPCLQWAGPEADAALTTAIAASATAGSYIEILGLTLPTDASAYISLYAVTADDVSFLARMHPKHRVPEFTRYRLPGFSAVAGASYRAVAEVAVNFLPLIEDDDLIPFRSLTPIQYMLMAKGAMDTCEVKTAENYRAVAERELVLSEAVEDERQSLVIVNNLYDLSNGTVSEDWRNA